MAKRFIDDGLFQDEWFIDLPNEYKLLWIYLITNCDNAGIFKVSYKLLNFHIGKVLEPSEVKRVLGDRIIEIDNGKKWFLPKFLKFQYPNGLNSNKPAIISVRKKIKENGLCSMVKELFGNDYLIISQSLDNNNSIIKDKDKGKDKDLKTEKVFLDFQNIWNEFAKKNNLPTITTITDKRKKHIKRRLSEKEFNLIEVLEAAKTQSFLFGDNKRGWKMSFDWLIESPNNYIKILERVYSNNKQTDKDDGVVVYDMDFKTSADKFAEQWRKKKEQAKWKT